ncbi:predicted protein [Coccidioides posadasii str. Silveira]|uniref:Predicted protein n=2 Tax=Coccidioides posadasii TaxID=199306 RepID=E9CU39_COCPS|nr:predicted protein [Coccidioides posadasii str. Silveira]KMM64233.1 hypothetical protein CPAG_00585 [Coccidioides posadasii RMSCC 3488]
MADVGGCRVMGGEEVEEMEERAARGDARQSVEGAGKWAVFPVVTAFVTWLHYTLSPVGTGGVPRSGLDRTRMGARCHVGRAVSSFPRRITAPSPSFAFTTIIARMEGIDNSAVVLKLSLGQGVHTQRKLQDVSYAAGTWSERVFGNHPPVACLFASSRRAKHQGFQRTATINPGNQICFAQSTEYITADTEHVSRPADPDKA